MSSGIESFAPVLIAGSGSGSVFRDEPVVLESRGWSSQSTECAPKIVALASLVNLGPPEPVASVSYQSRGNLLIVAGAAPQRARACAERLCDALHVTLLDAAPSHPGTPYSEWSGTISDLDGFLGEFTATLAGLATPGGPRAEAPVPARFDLVLDFSGASLFTARQPPQGYFHVPPAGLDDAALEAILAELREGVGEFEKPKYFAYRESTCAHARSQVTGCNACIEVCSTQAIEADGDHVKVDAHLCMGCGACATVCPSGAMTFQFPRVADRGAQMKQLLAAYRHAGGSDAWIVFHDGAAGRELLAAAAASQHGLPAHALPLEAWHVAGIGLDLLLPAIAFGAARVVVIAAAGADREYLRVLREQMAIGQAVLSGLGYAGSHFALVEAARPEDLAPSLAALGRTEIPATPASFLLSADKRTSIEFAVEHLVRHAPRKVDEIALPAGSPYGSVAVDRDACTMCMACVGACPASALMDGTDEPRLKFLERNCVQCGLCAATCPEDAITLTPRLLLTPRAREAVLLNQTEPFHCVSCGKAFGTRQMVDAMLGRLAGHSMFSAQGALRRLQMCGDCRVVDMMASKTEMSVLKLGDNP
jgi:ferredoxin